MSREPTAGNLILLPGSVEHASSLARDLRPADRLECEAYAGQPAEAVVRASYERSLWSWTAFGGCEGLSIPERPVCAWGVVPLSTLAGKGQPWCLTTDRVADHGRLFARASRAWLAALLADFAVLEMWVDGRHSAATRWTGWLGFHLEEPVMADGVPWLRAWMRRP